MIDFLRSYKWAMLIFAIIFILMFSFLSNMYSYYDKNSFKIELNKIPMKCYYDEKYNNTFLLKAGTNSYNNLDNEINRVDLKQSMILNINEYEVYYKNGMRDSDTTGWYFGEEYNYKEIFNSKIKIKIKRKNKVIYEGEYIKDLNKYIYEKGRYFIHIYVTRKAGPLSSVRTHITFNVIVGGGNHA